MKRLLCLLLGHHYTLFHTIYTSPVVTTLYRCIRCHQITTKSSPIKSL